MFHRFADSKIKVHLGYHRHVGALYRVAWTSCMNCLGCWILPSDVHSKLSDQPGGSDQRCIAGAFKMIEK